MAAVAESVLERIALAMNAGLLAFSLAINGNRAGCQGERRAGFGPLLALNYLPGSARQEVPQGRSENRRGIHPLHRKGKRCQFRRGGRE